MDLTKLNPNESLQIHNYSFEAIQAFVQEVKKYPIIYNGCSTSVINTPWPKIVTSLLENGFEYNLTPSQRVYWERIYRQLWVWMRIILTKDIVERCLGHASLRQNPKFYWLEYLEFLEPFIKLKDNSITCFEADLDPCIHVQVMTTEEVAQAPYCQHIVYWKQSQETLVAETFYISMCVRTMCYEPIDQLQLELDRFFTNLSDIKHIEHDEDLIVISPVLPISSNDFSQDDVKRIFDEHFMPSSHNGINLDPDELLVGYFANVN